ncbi:hypothetical protein [Allomuricauda sp. NBRC 101325]|uniref:hypothetical protein n=1 Tax=Allomuricauda sp. NBRC 101325 TaxID=1113758 RepID=UPI0024A1F6B4|nr:hypothetical protein [Muricauda sp. NBRC 101325]GLU44897.1 hypothetical protein Musp01_25210 [Muricauda sp. NBRC 101325]
MKTFFKTIVVNFIVLLVVLELVIRIFGLTDDVPHRKTDQFGLQVYIEGQTGYSHGNKWKVNKYGFLGDEDINENNQLFVIGDSFIENFMNPNSCRQSQLFKDKGFNVFEVGRSGITFIESLEFLKNYKSIVNPKAVLIYIDNSDLLESIKEIKPYNDRAQFNIAENKLETGEIKGQLIKRILYSYKTLYYLYLKFQKSQAYQIPTSKDQFESNKSSNHFEYVQKLIGYCTNRYDLSEVYFVFREKNEFTQLFNENELKFIELDMTDSKYIFTNDSHWNCEGHKEANFRVFNQLSDILPVN